MRARIFPFLQLGKALPWFHTLPAESKQDWEVLTRNFMKEYHSSAKTRSLRNKIDTFVQFPTEMIAEALEHFNEYMRAELLEGKIDSLMRRLEKMEIEREARDLKAAKARSTCEECGEYDHVHGDCPEKAMVLDYMRKGDSPNFHYRQGKPKFNASPSIQNSVPLCIQLKDFMDEQVKINKDTVTKFKVVDKVLENIDSKVTEVRSSIQ
jgi:hypothetical protein